MSQLHDLDAAYLARCLFDESNDALLIVDPHTKMILDANPFAQRLTGRRKKQLLRMSLEELLDADDADENVVLLRACETTSVFHSQEGFQLRDAAGQLRDLNVSVSRLHTEASTTLALITMRDVSERKQVEHRLMESNEQMQKAMAELAASHHQITRQERLRALGQLAIGAAHDLNNTLTPIVALSEFLLQEHQMDDNTRATLELIKVAAADATSIVGRLWKVYHPQNDSDIWEPVALEPLLQQIKDLTRPKWRDEAIQKGRQVDFHLQLQSVPTVLGRAAEIRQVLTNLVFNAVDAMVDGGRLTMRLLQQGPQQVTIEVQDTGIGMSPAQLQRCRDPFYTTQPRGAGLGLSICHRLIEAHQGRLEIDSQVGLGTCVSIHLPTLQEDSDATKSARVAESDPQPLNVLYVDDEATVRRSITALLQSLGLQVDTAASGPAAVEMFREHAYDVVITDMGMPDCDGLELTKRLKQINADVPVILISGWETTEDSQTSLQGAPDHRLNKPVTLTDFQAALDAVRKK